MDPKKQKIHSLLICNSNMFIPVTLTELLANPEQQYLVMSDTDNIRRFYEMLELPNVTYHHYGFNLARDGRLGFVSKRRELLEYVSQFEIGKVVFFHAEFGALANWLIEKLSKRNIPIKYCKLYNSIPAPKAPWCLKRIKIFVSEWLYYGQYMNVLKSSYIFPSLPDSFFRKVNAETIKMPINVELNGISLQESLKKFNIHGLFVLLTGTTIKDRIYTEEQYTPFINDLIEGLGIENVVSKCHPRYNDFYGLENELPQIPSFIPGNVILDSFKYYIGCESTLLVEAAQAGKIAISYIDWLKPDEHFRQTQHRFFESRLQGKGKIYFPKSMAELKNLVDNE